LAELQFHRGARPKIETATLRRERASSTSSTVPLNEANGPSDTRTCSPTSNEIEGLGPLDALLHLIDDALGFGLGNRHRLVVGAEESGDFGYS